MGDRIELKCYAKVNLGLAVLGRRADGYHDIDTVCQTVGMWDTLMMRPARDWVRVVCNDQDVAEGEGNLVYRAASALRQELGLDLGADIELRKEIPVGGGLGGGSSDCATTLIGAARLWGIDGDDALLLNIAARLGSDVPFFLKGGTARLGGRGEKVTPLHALPPTGFVIATPAFSVSTSWAYCNLKTVLTESAKRVTLLSQRIEEGDVDGIAVCLANDFESLVFTRFPILAWLKERLVAEGAIGASLSGTGSTVFGLCRSFAEALVVASRLNLPGWRVKAARPISAEMIAEERACL